jgi:hypothetical protein
MLATRQVGAFLSLMVVQEREDGETLVSVMPLPYGLALLTWLAGAWLAGGGCPGLAEYPGRGAVARTEPG